MQVDGVEPSGLRTLDRAAAILGYFLEGPTHGSLIELTEFTGLHKATVLRLANALVKAGLLTRESDGSFAVGAVALQLGASYLRANPLRRSLLLGIQTAAAELEATIQCCCLWSTDVVVTYSVEGVRPVRASAQTGEHIPVYASAAGKAILAGLSAERRRQIVDATTFTAFTPHTITSAETLAAELERAGERGYATSVEEYHLGLASIAVAVDERIMSTPAAVVAMVPSSEYDEESVERIGQGLRRHLDHLTVLTAAHHPV